MGYEKRIAERMAWWRTARGQRSSRAAGREAECRASHIRAGPIQRHGGRAIRDLINVQPPVERAMLVAAPRKGSRDVTAHAGAPRRTRPAGGHRRRRGGRATHPADRSRPTPARSSARARSRSWRRWSPSTGATLVIFDEELTPVQGANLERELKVRVMDRAEVILDIFSTRARSHEAKLQVELAQLEYLLPRLTRMWTHLSRIRGGIGLRGPGETQLETDRRMIRQQDPAAQGQAAGRRAPPRDHARRAASPMLERGAGRATPTPASRASCAALSGEHEIVVEDRLFATLDTLTREVDLGEGYRARVTDTVGFIRKLPHHLVASFRATLEEARRPTCCCTSWTRATPTGKSRWRWWRRCWPSSSCRPAGRAGVQQDRSGGGPEKPGLPGGGFRRYGSYSDCMLKPFFLFDAIDVGNLA